MALVSGGKDSCCSLMECAKRGHRVVAIANLHPQAAPSKEGAEQEESEVGSRDELDSFMFQTVGWNVIQQSYAQCLGVPLFCRPINGTALSRSLHYNEEEEEKDETRTGGVRDEAENTEDEVEDLFQLLIHVKQQIPDVQAVCSGAIFSDYQRNRVEHV